jgi:methionyl-tRNA synthetase
MLNLEVQDWDKAGTLNLLPLGHQLNEAALLFEKIEDSEIDAQIQKLMDSKILNEQAAMKAEEAKPNVSFEQFSAMDIRIGTILEAEKVAKTKKLLKLKIDTGLDQRTIVSGIAEYYEPEQIIGKQVSVLINLEPREIKGILSQGMILMSESLDGNLSFVTPSTLFPNGSTVR